MSNKKYTLTEDQKKGLMKLWFIYGNRGKKHSHGNHRFIQCILEHGEDEREFYRNMDLSRMVKAGVDPNTQKITQECIDKVDEVLKANI
jgi:hypothetical protein